MIKKNYLMKLCLLAIVFLAALTGRAQSIPQNFFGVNAWMPDTIGNASACVSQPCILYGKLHNNWQKVKQSKMQIVRFGGIAPDKNRPTNYQYIKMVDSIRNNGMEPVIQVPYFNGYYSASQAASIVQYINVTKGRNVKYWIIGNEPNLVYNYTNASQVAGYIKPFASAMKAVDPSILIIGPEFAGFQKTVTDDLTNPGGTNDITGRDANGRFYIDIFSYHTYPMGDGNSYLPTRSDVIGKLTSYWSFQDELVYLNTRLAAANTSHTRTGTSALKAAITEANVDYLNNSNDNLYGVGANSFIGAQFVSEMYGIGMRQGLAFITLWSTIEGNSTASNIGFLDASSAARKPMYYHLKMMAENFKGNAVNATDNQTNVKTFASKSSSLTNVMIMNQDASVNYTFTVRLNTSSVTAASPLKINVDAGTAVEYSDVIQNQSTTMLTFDPNGNLVQKTVYTLGTQAANGLAPVETIYTVTPADLVVKTPSAGSASVLPNTAISLSSTIYNSGSNTATVSKVGYYLSTDSIFSQGDQFLGYTGGTSLAGLSGSLRSGSVTIPSVAAGNYFLLFYADHAYEVQESNENNNVRALPLAVGSATVLQLNPDLQVSAALLSQSTVAAGSALTLSVTVYNGGTAVANGGKTGYYLSPDSLLNSSDVLLGFTAGNTIQVGASAANSISVTMPSTLQAGNYYVLYIADYAGEILESNESNNKASRLLGVTAQSGGSQVVDLTIQATTVSPSPVTAGNNVNLTSLIFNSGNAQASSSRVGYYLSLDTILGSSDQYLGFAEGYALAGASTAVRTATCKISTKQAGGYYYILSVADHFKIVTESNENNNVRASQLRVYGRKENISYQLAARPSGTSEITGTITATDVTDPSILYNVSISADAFLDVSDRTVGEAVLPSGSASSTFGVSLPSDIKPGKYFVFLTDKDTGIKAQTLMTEFEVSGDQVTAIGEVKSAVSMNIFPNPTTGRINIAIPSVSDRESQALYEVVDVTGKQIESRLVTIYGDTLVIDLPSGLTPGVYIVKISTGDVRFAKNVLLTN
jgi:subtilase family serine protease